MFRLIREAMAAWDRWRWKRRPHAPRSIVKMQDELQRQRRAHKPTRSTLDKIKAARHAALKAEMGR